MKTYQTLVKKSGGWVVACVSCDYNICGAVAAQWNEAGYVAIVEER